MRPHLHRASLLLLLPALTGCAIGAYISPISPLERQINGLYEGIGSGLTGRVPYRLVLTAQQKGSQVSGVLTNLESRKAYALSGTFQKVGESITLEAALFEEGDKHRGNLRGELKAGQFKGNLRTVLLGKELLNYNVELNRVNNESGRAVAPGK